MIIVKTKIGSQIIGTYHDTMKTPEDMKRRYPKEYNFLRSLYNGYEKEFKGQFPYIFVKISDTGRKYYYINSEELDNFIFEDTEETVMGMLEKKIKKENYNKFKYITHRTAFWKQILREGVKPITITGFRELNTIKKPYSMWLGNTVQTWEKGLMHVGGVYHDGIIVSKNPTYTIPLLKFLLRRKLLTGRMLSLYNDLHDIYISFQIVYPRNFIKVYSPSGKTLWKK